VKKEENNFDASQNISIKLMKVEKERILKNLE
jgi:hypothetical protein